MRLQRLLGVRRAGGVVAAGLGCQWRDEPPIDPDRRQGDPYRDPPRALPEVRLCVHRLTSTAADPMPSRPSARSRSAASSADSALPAEGCARTTIRSPGFQASSRAAHKARRRRATRCRTTELPTDLLTMKPTRGGSALDSAEVTCTTTVVRAARRPPRTAAEKSTLRRILCAAGSTGQAARRARPLRRRDERIDRPARVRMRSRKPWVLARRRLLGWNVRFDTGTPRMTGRARRGWPPQGGGGTG